MELQPSITNHHRNRSLAWLGGFPLRGELPCWWTVRTVEDLYFHWYLCPFLSVRVVESTVWGLGHRKVIMAIHMTNTPDSSEHRNSFCSICKSCRDWEAKASELLWRTPTTTSVSLTGDVTAAKCVKSNLGWPIEQNCSCWSLYYWPWFDCRNEKMRLWLMPQNAKNRLKKCNRKHRLADASNRWWGSKFPFFCSCRLVVPNTVGHLIQWRHQFASNDVPVLSVGYLYVVPPLFHHLPMKHAKTQPWRTTPLCLLLNEPCDWWLTDPEHLSKSTREDDYRKLGSAQLVD